MHAAELTQNLPRKGRSEPLRGGDGARAGAVLCVTHHIKQEAEEAGDVNFKCIF